MVRKRAVAVPPPSTSRVARPININYHLEPFFVDFCGAVTIAAPVELAGITPPKGTDCDDVIAPSA